MLARPQYPMALFHYLAMVSRGTRLAWDCGTGNGQAAVGLAQRFARVLATDPGAEMIAQAIAHPRVKYAVAGYDTELADHSANLVTAAQAMQWFDVDQFVREARRVLVPGGVLAAWCYSMCRVEPAIDEVVDVFYQVTTGPYWPAERRHVDDGYRQIALPIDEMAAPPFEMVEDWTLPHLMGYVRTWSGVKKCVEARGEGPVQEFEGALRVRWGNPMLRRRVRWTLHMRVGQLR